MSRLSDYANKYPCARFTRDDHGVLELALHTDGGPLQWSLAAHRELPEVFREVGDDPENKVVILTGTGEAFSEPRVAPDQPPLFRQRPRYGDADRIVREGKALITNFLNIDVPVISAINGPVWRHAEIPLLADIVLAADTACFQDSAHFSGGLVPGDGMHLVMPLLLGPNRARYFLLTGQTIEASQALQLGLVAEVLAPQDLLPRAHALARQIASKPRSLARLTRSVLTEQLKRQTAELLGYGLHAEFYALSYTGDDDNAA